MNYLCRIFWLITAIVLIVNAIEIDDASLSMQCINASLLCTILYFLERFLQWVEDENNQNQKP